MTAPTRAEIEERLRDLVVSEFDRRVVEASRRLPRQCVHHVEHALDDRKYTEDVALGGDEPNPNYNRITRGPWLPVVQTIGLCGLNIDDPESWNGTTCDEPIDAQRCPYFTPRWTRKNLVAQFKTDFEDLDWVRRSHPEVAALMWVLGRAEAPKLPWWKRIILRFRRIQLEPKQPPFNVEKLLEPPKG